MTTTSIPSSPSFDSITVFDRETGEEMETFWLGEDLVAGLEQEAAQRGISMQDLMTEITSSAAARFARGR
jgi:hypothetical protein